MKRAIQDLVYLAAIAGVVLLTACGFRPMYGEKSTTSAGYEVNQYLAAISIDPISDRLGQQLHNRLRDHLNPYGQPANEVYTLHIELEDRDRSSLARSDLGASRKNLRLRALYALIDGEGKVLLQDEALATSGYDVFRDPYNDISAFEDTERRAVELLAQSITNRLAVYFSQQSSN